ncbi:MAG: hypothetical protein HKN34_04505 [Gammaproteobacteria bacterium]|nr:hypothetical protein [Gammaproteobacteria bacterium]
MKLTVHSWSAFLAAVLICISWPTAGLANIDEPDFESLLKEAGLSFRQPATFEEVEVKDNALFPYERAIRKTDGSIEVRYAIRPLSRISIDYEDPHNAAPEPNHIFSMMFTALIGRLSNGGSSPHREYQQEEASEKFNADWAALSLFDVEPDYSKEFRMAFLVALHKNDLSDAYVVILFDDLEMIKPQLEVVMSSLRFE